MFASFTQQARAYSTHQVEASVHSADPHQLVSMLLEGAMAAIGRAITALENGDIPAKCKAVSHAVRIVDEGLRGALDKQAGGEVAATLDNLYSCILVRLTEANVRNDAALLRDCNQLLAPMRDAWNSIKPQPLAA